jgi:hypothetical protein
MVKQTLFDRTKNSLPVTMYSNANLAGVKNSRGYPPGREQEPENFTLRGFYGSVSYANFSSPASHLCFDFAFHSWYFYKVIKRGSISPRMAKIANLCPGKAFWANPTP